MDFWRLNGDDHELNSFTEQLRPYLESGELTLERGNQMLQQFVQHRTQRDEKTSWIKGFVDKLLAGELETAFILADYLAENPEAAYYFPNSGPNFTKKVHVTQFLLHLRDLGGGGNRENVWLALLQFYSAAVNLNDLETFGRQVKRATREALKNAVIYAPITHEMLSPGIILTTSSQCYLVESVAWKEHPAATDVAYHGECELTDDDWQHLLTDVLLRNDEELYGVLLPSLA